MDNNEIKWLLTRSLPYIEDALLRMKKEKEQLSFGGKDEWISLELENQIDEANSLALRISAVIEHVL